MTQTATHRRGAVVEAVGLGKRFGAVHAVSDVSFRVEPGRVTGFLGPNGAGKTTTLRMVLGLVRPTSGTVHVDGAPYARLDHPLSRVGAALDGAGAAPGRTGLDHLRWLAAAGGLPTARCHEVLALTGLQAAARRRVAGYSLGMKQRLALAAALLGDPDVLVLDEPANGLDPEGIAWLRGFLRTVAGEGRTVLVSSHVLSEVEQTVDDAVVMSGGRIAYSGDLAGLGGPPGVLVDSPDLAGLVAALDRTGWVHDAEASGGRRVAGAAGARTPTPAEVGAVAAAAGLALSLLAPSSPRLEDAFLRLVHPGAAAAPGPGDVTTGPPPDPTPGPGGGAS